MKKILSPIVLLLVTIMSYAQGYTYVSGYTKSNGTYVPGHYRTLPNETRNDNWSTIGNVNPFTGVAGTKPGDSYYSSYYSTPSYSYSSDYYSSYSTPSYYSGSSGYSSSTYSTYRNYSNYSSPSYNSSYYYKTPTYSSSSYYSRY